VLPNLIGNMLLNMILAFIISLIFSVIFFKEQGAAFIILYVLIFTIMCGLWIVNVVLTGFKSYKFIVFSFAVAYITFFLLALYMARYDLTGLMFSFFVGQAALFFLLLGYFIKTHYSDKIISFDFFDRHKIYISLIFSGFFYNLGIWIDKFIFWFYPDTSIQILGPIRASIVYDIPMFLAYIAIAPGMAVFFLKLETEFADYYDRYYRAVREGATLNKIYQFGDNMILSARSVIFDTLRIQGIAFVFFLIFDTLLFKIFKLSLLYIPLFHVLMVGTYLQLIFMTLLAILNYFDRRREALYLSILFAVSNAVFTYVSILLGPYFYGYGYVLSLFISDLLAIILLRRFLDEIHYQTFMLI
ncbi:MAG: exopolysaccharide Pel transporter PelG, partial [Sulfurihydrogenibium sp.]|nr:exopolysaccharide Pel transporter PelG [Sulfurihydrogenibium sp.]